MNTFDELALLKKCICEFLNKLLPTIRDPLILTRQRFSQFKTVLLDELKTTQDLYQYVQNLQFQQDALMLKSDHSRNPSSTNLDITIQNTIQKTTNTNYNQPATYQVNQPPTYQVSQPSVAATKTTPNIPASQQAPTSEDQKEIPKLGKDIFFKRPSTRKLSIKTKEIKTQDNYYKPMDEIQKFNVYGLRTDNFQQLTSSRNKAQVDKDLLLMEIKNSQNMIRKHTTTLGAVYSRSFEILTGDKEQQEQINSFQQSIKAQQDLREIQNAQRNATLKGYSIYAKQDKDVAKQKIDEIASINDKKKLYF